ncbi:serine hydrolase [Aliikangiella sp. G2MR2-5]|uniref:serine hydrolase domain-containing protein n=1 Tax=Aliikangiella sp. G2MR2-5 TaxID=2788943 RepID=UPI0018A905B0|nr:serine hydrolase domain-containing protein [Aliikangiella sp. G2MR2-5]
MKLNLASLKIITVLLLTTSSAWGAISEKQKAQITQEIENVMDGKGAPVASVLIVQRGEVVYKNTLVDPNFKTQVKLPKNSNPRYKIGSISKQFTAASLLILQDQGKLSVKDPVAKWFPELTNADKVTIANLLSMTSGYPDYWPHDYVYKDMLSDVDNSRVIKKYAMRSADFYPGEKFEYSNTNYLIAGRIVEQVSGLPLYDFMKKYIFQPLKMDTAISVNNTSLADIDTPRFLRNAIGPIRNAPEEGKGWLYSAGDLAMSARDLAKWNQALIDESLLSKFSMKQFTSQFINNNGIANSYGLGIAVSRTMGTKLISHSGAVSGSISMNRIYPEKNTSIIMFFAAYPGTSSEQFGAIFKIEKIILSDLEKNNDKDDSKVALNKKVKKILKAFQAGRIERALFSENANFYFQKEVVADFAESLKGLGELVSVEEKATGHRGGMSYYAFDANFKNDSLRIDLRVLRNGLIEQFGLSAN